MTSYVRNSLESHASVENSHHVGSRFGKSHTRSLQFHSLSTWSQLVSGPLPAAWPRYPVLPVVRELHLGLSPHTIQGTGTKGGTIWELIRCLGILIYPSPPGWAYLQPTSLIRKILPSLHMGLARPGFLQGDWLWASP